MNPLLSELVALLKLERIEQDLFRGQSQNLGWGRVFGGQVLGQALSAAEQTVPEDRSVHSLHGYFLRPGAVDKPVVYTVDRIRDGRSFTTRRVVALQNGRAIFNLAASFQIAEDGFDHQDAMPDVPGPDGILSQRELALQYADKIPESLRSMALAERPIEIRAVEDYNVLRPQPMPPKRHLWYRTSGSLPDAANVHECTLAYASDFQFLGTSLQPHGATWLNPKLQVASLDHAMWFHRPFRFDEWLLYVVDSPNASGGRGLVRGQFFNQAGHLVASTTQQGLIRQRD
ncbi:MAG: acyl-CoA thioesterase-2 [Myxococcota bacterium]|jgi:acyl-CoA thioesterase-2